MTDGQAGRQTDKQTDGWTRDKNNFTGRCPTNVERPIMAYRKKRTNDPREEFITEEPEEEPMIEDSKKDTITDSHKEDPITDNPKKKSTTKKVNENTITEYPKELKDPE